MFLQTPLLLSVLTLASGGERGQGCRGNGGRGCGEGEEEGEKAGVGEGEEAGVGEGEEAGVGEGEEAGVGEGEEAGVGEGEEAGVGEGEEAGVGEGEEAGVGEGEEAGVGEGEEAGVGEGEEAGVGEGEKAGVGEGEEAGMRGEKAPAVLTTTLSLLLDHFTYLQGTQGNQKKVFVFHFILFCFLFYRRLFISAFHVYQVFSTVCSQLLPTVLVVRHSPSAVDSSGSLGVKLDTLLSSLFSKYAATCRARPGHARVISPQWYYSRVPLSLNAGIIWQSTHQCWPSLPCLHLLAGGLPSATLNCCLSASRNSSIPGTLHFARWTVLFIRA